MKRELWENSCFQSAGACQDELIELYSLQPRMDHPFQTYAGSYLKSECVYLWCASPAYLSVRKKHVSSLSQNRALNE